MTQPVWPDQWAVSRAESFSGSQGSPALPKMASTKSRLPQDEAGGREEARFHGARGAGFGRRADDGAEEQGDEEARLFGLVGGEGQGEQVGGRIKGSLEEFCEGDFGDGNLVGGNGQAAFDDVEDAFGGAAVAFGVVKDALGNAIGLEVGRSEVVFAGGEGHGSSEAGAVEDKGLGGEPGGGGFEIGVEEGLDAVVDGAESVAEELVLTMEAAEERAGDFEEVGVGGGLTDGLAEGGELQVDVAEEFVGLGGLRQESQGSTNLWRSLTIRPRYHVSKCRGLPVHHGCNRDREPWLR